MFTLIFCIFHHQYQPWTPVSAHRTCSPALGLSLDPHLGTYVQQTLEDSCFLPGSRQLKIGMLPYPPITETWQVSWFSEPTRGRSMAPWEVVFVPLWCPQSLCLSVCLCQLESLIPCVQFLQPGRKD